MSQLEQVLTNIAGDVQLASLVSGDVVPLVIGTIRSVKEMWVNETTVEYTIVLSKGNTNLQEADAAFRDSLNTINTERGKAGKAPLAIPGA